MLPFLTKPVKVSNREVPVWQLGLTSLTALSLSYLAYKRITRPKFNSSTTGEEVLKGIDLTDKVVIVTGANTGLGKETTRVLLKHNAKVIMACRSDKRAQQAKEEIINTFDTSSQELIRENLDIIVCDLGALNSIYHFAQNFKKKYDKLDILINNAGVMAIKEFDTTEDGFEKQFGINHIGHAYLTRLLTPLLKKSAPSRVICLSSSAHSFFSPKGIDKYIQKLINEKRGPNEKEYSPWTNYGISKSCNILFAREYNRRHIKDGISCYSLHPGGIWTDLQRHTSTGLKFIFTLISPFRFKSLQQGVSTTLRCVQLNEDDVKKYNGHYFDNCQSAEFTTLRKDHRRNNTNLSRNVISQFYDFTYQLIKSKDFQLEVKD